MGVGRLHYLSLLKTYQKAFFIMNELVEKLVGQAGLTPEQARKTLEVIKEFVTEKFPMLGGAVENILQGGAQPSDPFDV